MKNDMRYYISFLLIGLVISFTTKLVGINIFQLSIPEPYTLYWWTMIVIQMVLAFHINESVMKRYNQ